jgi:hypothetical protein
MITINYNIGLTESPSGQKVRTEAFRGTQGLEIVKVVSTGRQASVTSSSIESLVKIANGNVVVT